MLLEAILCMLRRKSRKESRRGSVQQGTATYSPSPIGSSRTRQLLLRAGLCIALLGGAIIVWLGLRDANPTTDKSVPSTTRESRNTIWEQLQGENQGATGEAVTMSMFTERFAVFRRPVVTVPPSEAKHIRHLTGSPRDGLKLTGAHYAEVRHHKLWIATGKGIVCLAQAGRGSVACTTYARFYKHGLILGVVWPGARPSDPPKKAAAMGLVPASDRPTCVRAGPEETFVKRLDSEVLWIEASHLIHLQPCDRVRRAVSQRGG